MLTVNRGEKAPPSSDKLLYVEASTLSQSPQNQQSCKSVEQSREKASDHLDGGAL
jgi:hypothetical protein